MEEKDK
jgi:hypothetical protein